MITARSTSENNTTPTNTGILGLDRKAMEAERLARLASRKRPASVSPPRLERQEKVAQKKPKVETPIIHTGLPVSRAKPTTTNTNPSTLQYLRGIVKRTWSAHHPRDNDIKIE